MSKAIKNIEMWRTEIDSLKQKINNLKSQKGLIAFYGSSSIRMWENLAADLHPFPVINLGFGGSTFKYCNHFFQEVFSELVPTEIILYGGDNDLSQLSAEQTLLHFQELFQQVITKYPTTNVSIISIKPSPERSYLEDQILWLNQQLKKEIEAFEFGTYIDIHPQMLNEQLNAIPSLFLKDQLHMNELGYAIWKEAVYTHLQNQHTSTET